MSCPANAHRQALEFVEDRLGCGDPHEGGGIGIAAFDESLDRIDELSDAVERALLDGPLADEAEPVFRLVEP